MSDPEVEREIAANERRAADADDATRDTGIVGTIDRAFPFFRDQDDSPDTKEEVDEVRRENDAEQRD